MTETLPLSLSLEKPATMRRPGIVAGIAISLVLHGLLIFGYRLASPTARQAKEPPAHTMTVWLQAPKPPEPVAKAEPPPTKPVQPRKREKTEVARANQPAPAAASSMQAQTITPPAPAAPAPDPLHPEAEPKKFDMNAALTTARKVANEKDPARAGTAVAQLDEHPLYPEERRETQLARGVAGAKRGDCKNTGAGLLSPLIWLLDKKDHGCKW